jgi:hypothetical protein
MQAVLSRQDTVVDEFEQTGAPSQDAGNAEEHPATAEASGFFMPLPTAVRTRDHR